MARRGENCALRIALVYDCLYPHTIGGAERWLRELSASLAANHEVTYVTRRQWARSERPDVPAGVAVAAVSPGGPLYDPAGRRRVKPPVLFALGVFLHFIRARRSYDVVHCLSYPFLSLIALRLALVGTRTRIYCEWLECPTPEYWRGYAGRVGGLVGRGVQRLCVRLTPSAFAFSELVVSRLRASGYAGEVHRLSGLWAGNGVARNNGERKGAPLVLFAGRHVPDKRVTVIPEAIRIAQLAHPGLRAVLVGDGPERDRVAARVRELDLEQAVSVPGFVSRKELDRLFGEAACLVSPSIRDGHGMVVVEAAAAGVPAVVCEHPDNAATELIDDGVNGTVAGESAEEIAAAIVRIVDAGEPLRESTAAWFDARRERFAMSTSIAAVQAVFEGTPAPAREPATPIAA